MSIQPPTTENLNSNPVHTNPNNISTLPTSDNKSSPVSLSSHHRYLDLSTYESPISTPPSGHIPSINPLSPSNLDHQTSPSHTRTKSLSDILQSLDQPKSTSNARYPLPQCYSTTFGPISEPMNYSSTSKQSNWVQAMQYEYYALIRNRTWLLVPRSSN